MIANKERQKKNSKIPNIHDKNKHTGTQTTNEILRDNQSYVSFNFFLFLVISNKWNNKNFQRVFFIRDVYTQTRQRLNKHYSYLGCTYIDTIIEKCLLSSCHTERQKQKLNWQFSTIKLFLNSTLLLRFENRLNK